MVDRCPPKNSGRLQAHLWRHLTPTDVEPTGPKPPSTESIIDLNKPVVAVNASTTTNANANVPARANGHDALTAEHARLIIDDGERVHAVNSRSRCRLLQPKHERNAVANKLTNADAATTDATTATVVAADAATTATITAVVVAADSVAADATIATAAPILQSAVNHATVTDNGRQHGLPTIAIRRTAAKLTTNANVSRNANIGPADAAAVPNLDATTHASDDAEPRADLPDAVSWLSLDEQQQLVHAVAITEGYV